MKTLIILVFAFLYAERSSLEAILHREYVVGLELLLVFFVISFLFFKLSWERVLRKQVLRKQSRVEKLRLHRGSTTHHISLLAIYTVPLAIFLVMFDSKAGYADISSSYNVLKDFALTFAYFVVIIGMTHMVDYCERDEEKEALRKMVLRDNRMFVAFFFAMIISLVYLTVQPDLSLLGRLADPSTASEMDIMLALHIVLRDIILGISLLSSTLWFAFEIGQDEGPVGKDKEHPRPSRR
jgi:hypothetical protein